MIRVDLVATDGMPRSDLVATDAMPRSDLVATDGMPRSNRRTDEMQRILGLVELLSLMCYGYSLVPGLYEVGGYGELLRQYPHAYPGSPESPYTEVVVTPENSTKCGMPLK